MPKGVSSKKVFKQYNQGQEQLFPRSLDSLIAENHPVRTISKVIDKLDLSSIYNSYAGGGASIYDPKMMLKIIIYAYFNNVYSCRGIERFVYENTHAMWLSGGYFPDFRTINSFRGKRIKNEIDNIFKNITMLLIEEGLLSLENVFVDGTKFESVANRYKFVWKKNVERNLCKLEVKINNVLKEIKEIIQSDEKTIDLPEELKEVSEQSIAEAVNQINTQLAELSKTASKSEKKIIKKAQTRVNTLSTELFDKYNQYKNSLETLGDRNSYAKTDEEATFMRLKNDLLRPCYNVQLSTENQIIVNYSVHQSADDTSTFIDHMESLKEKYGKVPSAVVADAAYGCLENWEYLEENRIDNYLKYNTFYKESTKKYRLDISKSDNLYYNEEGDFYVCPMGQRMYNAGTKTRNTKSGYQYEAFVYKAINCNACPLRGACHKSKGNRQIESSVNLRKHRQIAKENLNSEKGKKLRQQRNYDVEPVFGHIKSNRKMNRFRMKGLEKANLEIGLLSVVHNLKKLHKALEDKLLFYVHILAFIHLYKLISCHNRLILFALFKNYRILRAKQILVTKF